MDDFHQIEQLIFEFKANPKSDKDRLYQISQALNSILNFLAPAQSLHFPSIFTKISWISINYSFPNNIRFLLHTFRRVSENINQELPYIDESIKLGIFLCEYLITVVNNEEKPITPSFDHFLQRQENEKLKFKKIIEGMILQVDVKDKSFIFLETFEEDQNKNIKYDVIGENEIFTSGIELLDKIMVMPVKVNLIDVEIDQNEDYHFKSIVFQPDFLFDISTIASSNKSSIWLLPLSKLKLRETSIHILLGNLINHILNELLFNPEIQINEILIEYFKDDPLKWILYDDKSTIEITNKAKIAYKNLKNVLQNEFSNHNIKTENIYVEPSFISPVYGIQGRLDLLNVNKKEKLNNIIELKSGKIFKPNKYGINESHFNQCLLYDLLISTTYLSKSKTLNYLLYSVPDENNLRYAPSIKSLQYDLIHQRNNYILSEFALAHSPEKTKSVLSFLSKNNFPSLKGFVESELTFFENIYSTLDSFEKLYYYHFLTFISNEFIIRKLGSAEDELSYGTSTLWREELENKVENFSVLSNLIIIKNNCDKKIPTLEFAYTEESNSLSIFREGDIITILPKMSKAKDNIKNQIFKGTLIEYNSERIVVLLRHTQYNNEIFRKYDYWNIEPDFLDSSYKHLYNNMAIWASCTDKRKRHLILGIEKPEYYKFEHIIELSNELTTLQKNAILKAFYAKDYMLIWGPPGTGKTSMILKHLTKLILNYTNENILILAYTNKAVDEICHSLIDGGLHDDIIRIGSKINSNQNLHNILLNHQISSFKNRNEVIEFLKTKRIFISTISSFLGKLELLDLKKFDTLIIDEASQVIEPMLCGILTLVRKFILIGDHKQLPAIVQQNQSKSVITNHHLLERGFQDMRTSLFERLYSQISHKKEYNHAYCILTEQGRMHKKIMDFVNPCFYENNLKTIKPSQTSEPNSNFTDNTLYHILCTERVIFINIDSTGRNYKKRNEEEAICTQKIINSLINIYKQRDQKWHDETLGVITPFRAQINQIKHLVKDLKITIDTVERYQGGARDIIVMSTVINNLSQLKSIVSASLEGIDRKLNVAITRTRNQFILIGNEEILSKSYYYKKLIDYSHKLAYEHIKKGD